jgi:acetyl esterase/lipase
MGPQASYLNALGYAAIQVDFRTQEGFADAISDAFCALGWLHTNAAAYQLDLTRVAAFGYSNSGWQAALLGTVESGAEFLEQDCPHELPEDSRVQGVITYGGLHFTPTTLAASNAGFNADQRDYLESLAEVPPPQWGDILDENWTAFLRSYPVYWLDSSDTPMLLVHGEADQLIPVAMASGFADTATSAGVEVTLITLPQIGHDLLLLQGGILPELDAQAILFLEENLSADEAPVNAPTPTP